MLAVYSHIPCGYGILQYDTKIVRSFEICHGNHSIHETKIQYPSCLTFGTGCFQAGATEHAKQASLR